MVTFLPHYQKQKEGGVGFLKTSKKSDEIKRAQSVLLLGKKGGVALVFEMTGYSRRQAYDIKKRYLKNGISSLKDKRKGKLKELLTKQQRMEIVEIVKTKTPREFGYEKEFGRPVSWETGSIEITT